MDKNKRSRVLERIGIVIGTVLLLYFLFKFATYFMPFLIAGIIAILIEPIIKFGMNKLKLSRRVSSMIVVSLTIIFIILVVIYGTSAIIKEITNLSKNIPSGITTATNFINETTKKLEELFPELKNDDIDENIIINGDTTSGEKIPLQVSGEILEISGDFIEVSGELIEESGEIKENPPIIVVQTSGDKNNNSQQSNQAAIDFLEIMKNSIVDFIGKIGTLLSKWATDAVKLLLSVPTMIINVVITILALIFFTKDRIYVIDMLEHHLPKAWLKKSKEVCSEIFATIGGYIRVYIKIIIITFAELYFAFTVINALGFKISYPLLLAILVAIVDILPILGVGTVLIPWSIWMFITGNLEFALALLIIYGAIFCIRQFMEPKLVSKQFGIHPLVTLFAMYAGYKSAGVFGLILGPILLMTLRCIFAKQIERGFFKDIFEEK